MIFISCYYKISKLVNPDPDNYFIRLAQTIKFRNKSKLNRTFREKSWLAE